MNFRTLSIAFLLIASGSLTLAEVSATISLSAAAVNEGDTGSINYSYTISVDNNNYRFFDNDGVDGTVSLPDGSSQNIFLTNTARQESQSGHIDFDANDDGSFIASASLSGSAGLQTISGGILGEFSFSASDSVQVTVLNVDPTFDEELPDLVIPYGYNVPVSVSASDPGLADILTFEWDAFVDGQIDFVSNDPSRTSGVNVFLPAEGFMEVKVSVDDGDGGTDQQQFLVTGLPGDYNQDNVVDSADFTVWKDSEGQQGAGLLADGNRDGTVDAADYAIWSSAYGDAFILSSYSVPEPTGMLLIAGLLIRGVTLRCRH